MEKDNEIEILKEINQNTKGYGFSFYNNKKIYYPILLGYKRKILMI